MDEVNIDPVDIRLELVERVQAILLSPPVVLLTPIFNDALEVCQVRAVVPPRIRKLVRKTPLHEPPFQIRQHGIGNSNFEGDDRLALWIGNLDNRENGYQDHTGRHEW